MYTYERELAVATNAALEAGGILLRYFGKDLHIHKKGGVEPVTEADRKAQDAISAILQKEFCDYGLLGEEQEEHQSWARFDRSWVVDPMDGTREFIAQRDTFAVMIGLLEQGRPVLGVVYQPRTRLLYRGVVGQLAECVENGEKRYPLVPSATTRYDQVRVVTSRAHRSPLVQALKQRLGITQEERIGSAGIKTMTIARGTHELYLDPESHSKLWDTCAPQAILFAAGGVMTNAYGQPLAYDDTRAIRHQRGVVASTANLHGAVIEALELCRAAGES